MNLLREYIRGLLLEQTKGGSLVVVDIQPEYESATPFDIGDMLRTASENYSRVLFLYNGEDTLGMVSESALKDFYFEKLDYDEEAFEELLSKSEFFDKGYGFFRDVMDSDICFPRQDIIKIVKYMIDNDIDDIRDLSEEDVNSIAVDDLLFDDLEDYGFNIPDLEEVLPRWSGSDIAGGARNECLAEVEILASAQGLSFNQVDQFIYEGDNRYTESLMQEKKRVARKKGQHRNSSSHSDLYTDENPKGTIKGLKFATVKDAEASVKKIKGSGRSHAHKIQAAVAMEQRAKVMGKRSAAAVYREFIDSQKKDESFKRRISEGSRIVPASMTMAEWERYKKKNKISAKAYDKKTKTKWKITHGPGHKDAGKTIKGNTGLTYGKAKSIQNAFGGW